MKKLVFLFTILIAAVSLVAFITPAKKSADSSFLISKIIYMTHDTIIPVKVKLEKTSFRDMPVLYITDTAQTTEAISEILGKDYGELMQYIQANKLQPKKFMAWYYSMQPPWQMDIAVETDRMPAELSGRVKSRMQQGGEVLIAHMWGPYNQVGQAYMQIENWLKENNRKAKGNPFEVYINDPSSVKSPAEIQTDVYQPVE